ncbi:hypothetical protein Tco_0439927 [Tanacetum coccineum]
MENQSDVQNHLVEIQADDHDLLVNSDNENDDMLGYESEKYSDDEDADGTNHAEDADGTNHSDLKLVKRGITRLYKFRKEYGKPGGIKIKEKSARGKMARSKNVYHHKMGRGGYVFVKEKMASKCKLWHLKKLNIVALGTVYKSDGKQMLHNQAPPNDCYKVSIDSSLVDAACIPDVGNNGLVTVKDGVGGFFAWLKNQVVLDEEVTPPYDTKD